MTYLLVWLAFSAGFLAGAVWVGFMSRNDSVENARLRAAIARTRTAIALGNLKTAQRECERALGDEAA